ncbi:MAG: phenylacetate--CoA ligase family protein [Promethearchaeota archaeon]
MIRKYLYNIMQNLKGNSSKEQYDQIKYLYSEDEFYNFYKTYFKKILLHAHKNVPFFFQRLKKADVINNGTVYLSEFNRLPLLKKDDIRNHINKLTSRDIDQRKWHYHKTSGSTGEPLCFIQDKLENKWRNATQRYYFEHIVGIDELAAKKVMLAFSRAIFEGNIRFRQKVKQWLKNAIYLNTLKIRKTDMEHFTKIIDSNKPDMIEGRPSVLYELCKFLQRNGKTIHKPQAVVSSAEKLEGYMRDTIEGIFGTNVYDFYGATEAHAIAGECKAGLLHIFTFNNYVEILDEHNRPVREGEMGRIVVTPLHNYSMPLIRYEIGDMAILGPKRCKCGNTLPTLKEVVGRSSDFFIKEDGSLIIGTFFRRLFFMKEWIKYFQIIQEDYKKVRILVVPYDSVNDAKKQAVEQKIKSVMGKDCKMIWEIVDEIPRTQDGKYFYIKSLLYDS